ncbi:FMN-dependent dehydrogenase-domain-containing protein [Durotheca rogersii]|uniref:FMN-dependent dehydrogenase-domain-containing protein n=1 Tax=Durotheca rogersii TaxID=419775 RepID=UPI002220EEA2|nr:FMN-dependent dehydrogenase-domain-containing protein [Durotheca rogersii]KAI5863618.1 FMN-dependent dehydrogenase-domain-containing protein [Durotheca rogersii]
MALSAAEVSKHKSISSCWIVIDNKVYDVTPYLEEHPGGTAILVKQGGRDATAEFRTVHSPDVLEYLPKGSYLGTMNPVDVASLPAGTPSQSADAAATAATKPPSPSLSPPSASPPPASPQLEVRDGQVPHIAHCVRVTDFEDVARGVLSRTAYTYAASAAHAGSSLDNNLASWSRVTFRPRVLRDVRRASPRTAILGLASPFPFFVAPMGQLGRAHAGAEAELARGLARRGVHYLVSNESTLPMEEIAEALRAEQRRLGSRGDAERADAVLFPPSQLHFQLYVHSDRAVTVARIRRARAAGFQSLWITVDVPALGKRTPDRRLQAAEALDAGLEDAAEQAGFGRRSHAPPDHFQPSLSWADLDWIRREWGDERPILLKGVQCAEDARLALRHGLRGVLLSNHGGRQAHAAPDALSTLLEIRAHCPEVLGHLEIYVDGGLRDGADVLKAICLGATAVGIGRPFLYALGAYGARGVERCIDILSEELVTGMRLLGISSLDEARPDRVNASRLMNEIWYPEKSRL